jgi:hypothetical protein
MAVTAAEASDAEQRSFEHVTELIFPCTPGARALARDLAAVAARHGAASDSARAAEQRVAGALAFGGPDATECGPLLERMVANGTSFNLNRFLADSERAVRDAVPEPPLFSGSVLQQIATPETMWTTPFTIQNMDGHVARPLANGWRP